MAAMPVRELNRDTYTFSHKGFDYSIYTFMTRMGSCVIASGGRWTRGQAKRGEVRADLIQRLKRQLDNL